MTTLPFERKNNLLSLLRGYDLPIKRNFLNSALLGFGKHHHHHHHHKKEKETLPSKLEKSEESEERFKNFLTTVDTALKKYFSFFSTHIPDDSFWYSNKFYDALCAFTRYFVASTTRTSSEFLSNVEGFLIDIVESDRYNRLLDDMDIFADEYRETGKSDEYEKIRVQSGKSIREISSQCLSQNVFDLDYQTIKNLILDCVIYSTNEPQEFESNFERYKTKVTTSSDKDILHLFSEDLQDTADNDDLESEGEHDSEDEKFVVPDDVIEYEDEDEDEDEYEEKPAKRRKLVPSKEDDEEVTGSGFYDWWW